MLKKKKNKESLLTDLIFRFRHALAFVTIIVFLMIYGFTSEAAQADVGNGNTYTVAEDFRTALGISENATPYTCPYNMFSEYELAGGNINNLTVPSAFPANSSEFSSWSYRYDNTVNAGIKVPTSITINGSTTEFSSNAYYMNAFCWNTASSQQWFYNLRIQGSGHIACILDADRSQGYYVVSDQPFTAGWTRYMAYYNSIMTIGVDSVDTAGDNGLYEYQPYYPFRSCLTNMPVYIPSTDGKSGFTTFNTTTTDFSFENDNFNFNDALASGSILDPNPAAPVGTYYPDSRYYLNTGVKTSFYGDSLHDFKIGYQWTGNNYTRLHPEQFNVKTNLRITFGYGDTDVENYEWVLEYPYSYVRSGRYEHTLDLLDFKDDQNNTLYEQYARAMSDITEASSTYVTDLIGISVKNVGISVYNETENSLVLDPHFRQSEDIPDGVYNFMIYADTVLVAKDISETESGVFSNHYDFLDGSTTTDLNNITQNFYPPEESGNPSLPASQIETGNQYANSVTVSGGSVMNTFDRLAEAVSYGGNPVATASIEPGAVVVNTGQNGFQLSAQGWTDYGTFYQTTGNTLMQLAQGAGNFGQVVQAAGAGIPANIWGLVLAGVGTSVCLGIWRGVRNH